MKFTLTQSDKSTLQQAVQRAESGTSAQIAWAIRDRSSSYSDTAYVCGIMAVIIGMLGQIIYEQTSSWNGNTALSLLEMVILFAAGMLLSKIPLVRRTLTSNARMNRRVQERAQATFFQGGVHLTSQHNGVLVYVSVFEKIITIIADKAIVDIPRLNELIQEKNCKLFLGVRRWPRGKEYAIAELTYNINELGSILQHHFQKMTDNSNEVPDGNVAG